MRLRTRFILLLGLILLAVASTVWFGVRPGYESAILSERITIISEQQRERIDLAESNFTKWAAILIEIQQNLQETGDIQQSRLLFSGFSSLVPELMGVRLTEQNSGEFVELRSIQTGSLPILDGVQLRPLGAPATSRFPRELAENLFTSWKIDSGFILLTSVFILGNDSYRLTAIFSDAELREILLSDDLGVDTRIVLWFEGADDGLITEGALPDVRPAYEPVTRFRELTVDGKVTVVVSSPISSLNALHVLYVNPDGIQAPVRRLFSHSMLVLLMAFFALTLASLAVFNQLSRPMRDFIRDIRPMASYDFSKTVRPSSLPELQELTLQLNEIRAQLAYYQRINVEKIITNQESLNLMMEYTSDPIAVFDADGEFTFRNNQFIDLFLDSDEPAPGNILNFDESHLFMTVKEHETDEYRIRPLLIRNIGREVKLVSEDNDISYIYDQQRVSVLNEEGALVGGLLILYDLTRERELDQLRNDMINIIVHELKNPIAGIRGLTQALIDDPDFSEEEFSEIYTLIDGSAESLQDLVERFLKISQLESNLANIERSPIDVGLLVKQVTAEMAIMLNEKSLKFNVDISDNLEPVMASYELFQDVVRNLVSNAIKYGGHNRTIDIELKPDIFGYNQTDLLFSVTDYGYGIPPQHHDNIFKKFYRIKEYDVEKGTGLGLPHVREIVRLHEGTITVESDADIGTRFTVRIPYKPVVGVVY
jgi:signal transduction histidine kinase